VQFAVGATSGSAATAVNNVIGSGPGFPGATTPLPAITLSPGDLLNFVGTGPIDVSATVSQALANLSTFSCGTNFFGVPLTCHSQFRSELLNDVARIRYHFDPSANPVRTWTQTRSDSGALFSLGINSLDQAQQGIYQFSKFDPSLGTLMAVEVDLSSNVLNRITSDGGRADFTTTVQFAVGATSGSTGTAVNNVIGSGPGFPGATTPLPVITLSPGDLLDFVGTGPIDVSATVSQALANLSTFSCGTNFFGVPLTCHSQFRSELVDDVAEIRYIFSEATAAAPAPPSAALVAIGLCLLVGYGFTGRAGSRS
jgi:hypothetical protein